MSTRIGGGVNEQEKNSIEKRLALLIDLWKDACPATVEILKWQSDIVAKFYGKGG